MHFNFEDHAVFKILLTIRVVNSIGPESDIDIVTAMVTVIVIVIVYFIVRVGWCV